MAIIEKTKVWDTDIYCWKFNDPDGKYARLSQAGVPMEAVVDAAIANNDFKGLQYVHGNVALNEGLQLVCDLIIGAGGTSYATPRIGVGDSATLEAATDTGLIASTNKVWVGMDSTYPKRVNQTLQFKATFAAGTGTWTWREVTVTNGTNDTGTNLNRKTGSWGDKGANDSYTMEVDITLS